jgi:hypothetical protein
MASTVRPYANSFLAGKRALDDAGCLEADLLLMPAGLSQGLCHHRAVLNQFSDAH